MGDVKAETQYITFFAAGQYFGLPVTEVQEVLQEPKVAHVSQVHRAVEGLINLRGRIIPAISLRRLLRMEAGIGPEETPGVVMRTAIGPVSLQVDDIGDVLELDNQHEPLPAGTNPEVSKFARGVRRLDAQLLLILDSSRIAALGEVTNCSTES